MNNITRRQSIVGITVGLSLIALKGRSAEDVAGPNSLEKNTADSVEASPPLQQLTEQLKAFFGTSTGDYLTGTEVTHHRQSIRSFDSERLYDQFAAVFEGPPEYNALIRNGMRMVVRFQVHLAQLKAAVILDRAGKNVIATALTYYEKPAGGYHINTSDGNALTLESNPYVSLVLFYRTPEIDPIIREATVSYFERWLATGADPDNPEANRMKVTARRLV